MRSEEPHPHADHGDETDLRGCRALVTGSSRGIGRAIALALARSRAAVVVHGRTESAELPESLRAVDASAQKSGIVIGDLSDPMAGDRIVQEASALIGGLNVLVNNAGLVIPVSPDALDQRNWAQTLAVNLLGPFFAAQAVLFLASRAADFVTGEIIHVDGGYLIR